jgi:hypothetical protein
MVLGPSREIISDEQNACTCFDFRSHNTWSGNLPKAQPFDNFLPATLSNAAEIG